MTKSRLCSRQIYRSNQPVGNTKDCFPVSLTIRFPDHFFANELTQCRGLYITPYVILNESSPWKKEFMVFAKYYEYFPNFNSLDAKLDLWCKVWDLAKFKSNFPVSISTALKRINSLAFPNTHSALKLLVNLPIATCERKQSFSSLRLVKTLGYITIKTARLSGLALSFIQREADLDVPDKTDLLAQKCRRIQLI